MKVLARVGQRYADFGPVSWEEKLWGVAREEVCAGLGGGAERSNTAWTEAMG